MSNFGVAFHNLLKRIHYPGINQYEPYNFDWFVYQPGLEPFLTWMITHLTDENILTDDELTRYAALKDQVIENPDERQKLLDILISLDNGKMIIPWTNYQRNLTEHYSCIKAQTQALKNQLNHKQQQYKSLLMKGPKVKEKIRETRRQIEQLLQLTSPQNLLTLVQSSSSTHPAFQQIGMNFLQLERNYLSMLHNVWTDEILYEHNANLDLIKQLNHRTVKLVRLEVESALANVEFDTLKSQLQLCSQLKKYFDSTSVEDLRKLADRLGSKSQVQQQQRTQYESQLMNIYFARHEHQLESIYYQILEQQLNNHQNLYSKQQLVLDGLTQQRHFCNLIDGLINHRLTLIDRTNELMSKLLHYIQMIVEQSKTNLPTKSFSAENENSIAIDLTITNLIERMKGIEAEFSNHQSMINQFLDYVHRQNEDFRPKANDLSNELNRHLEEKFQQWNNVQKKILNE